MKEYGHLIVYFLGFFVAVYGGAFLVKRTLKPFDEAADQLGGMEKAGRLIGIFERAIIVVLVFEGGYNALGLIIAAKSIARFNRLKEREAAEYYLVGTLASVGFAILIGLLTKLAALNIQKLF